jgi:tetratricopeptide (TPR) repeat protein
MSETLANPLGRRVAMAFAFVVAVWMIYAGFSHAVAGHYGASTNPAEWLRAAQVEPSNAENWYRVGRYRQLDFDRSDIPLAISYYRRAVQLDPESSFYKLDLASALEMAGKNAEAEQFFRAAQQNYPISAEVSWKFGNFLLRQQRLPEAYEQIHRAVLEDSNLIPLAVSRAWHSDPDVNVILNKILPETAEADWQALSYFVQMPEPQAAIAVWDRLISRKPAIDSKVLFAYIDMLWKQNLYDQAGSAWQAAMAGNQNSPSASQSASLIFDGGFENDISGGGFGWRQEDVPGVDFDFDADMKHSGARSARLTFDGTQNMTYQNLYQYVLVTPATRYRFQGYLRTDTITTDSGVRFQIYDQKNMQGLNVLTPNETGTKPWTLEELDFTTGPQTRLIRVQVTRAPSRRLDNKVNGTVWVDDASIVPYGSKP